jgi:hypothetical protein
MQTTAQQVQDFQKLGREEKEARFQQRLAQRGFSDRGEFERSVAQRTERMRPTASQIQEGLGGFDRLQQSIERDRKVAEYKNFAEGFRPINDALVKMGDLAVKLGGAGAVGEVYKKFAPPGSEFYQKGTLEEKTKKAIGV